jgi:hypothetical protein
MYTYLNGAQCIRAPIRTMKQFLRERDQAAILRVSARTLREWRFLKIVPYFKVGRVVFYDPERVNQALLKFERKEAV